MSIHLSPQMNLAALPDAALLELADTGNQRAFEILVERYHETLYRFAVHLVDTELAYDVLQFAWLQLYRTMPGLVRKLALAQNDTRLLKSWLFCVARNRCMDELRKRRRYPLLFSELFPLPNEEVQPLLNEILDSAPLPEELAEQHDDRARLHDAIETLPPKYRLIVWLRYSQELSFNEIGSKLQMPAATVKTYFYRSKLKLGIALTASYVR